MNRIATVTYNRYANFTNYGSALQTYALKKSVERLGDGALEAICLNYCPDSHVGVNPLDPESHMWDADEESRYMVRLSLQAIRENLAKFERFYDEECCFTSRSYTSGNVGDSWNNEGLSGYVCGSDTIFCIREFDGFDEGYYANVPQMRGRAVAYAASFGDVEWTDEELDKLAARIGNFRAIGLREGSMLRYCRKHTAVPVERVADPTLLLRCDDYLDIAASKQRAGNYLLLYSRRYDHEMEVYAERVACQLGCEIVEISLRATNVKKGHEMRYDAGVEEFLALVRDAQYMVTNSYHGLVFALQMGIPFSIFTREQASSKIRELLEWVGLEGRMLNRGVSNIPLEMNFDQINHKIEAIRGRSLAFLRNELELLEVL